MRIEPPGGRGITFKPTVTLARPNRELRWLGHFVVPGLCDGEHMLRTEPRRGGSWFIQSERFTGALVALVGGTLARTESGFRQMNAALKERAERR